MREAIHVRMGEAVVLDRVAIAGHLVSTEPSPLRLLLERIGVQGVAILPPAGCGSASGLTALVIDGQLKMNLEDP